MKSPILKTSTPDELEAVTRALWAAGYRREGCLDLDDTIRQMRGWKHGLAYVYLDDDCIVRMTSDDYRDRSHRYILVNSPAQLVRQLARHS